MTCEATAWGLAVAYSFFTGLAAILFYVDRWLPGAFLFGICCFGAALIGPLPEAWRCYTCKVLWARCPECGSHLEPV